MKTKTWRERIQGTVLHDLAGVWMLAWSYAPIVGAYYVFHRWPSVPTFLLAFVMTGVRMNALFVVTHEAFHYNLFRWRPLNVWLGGGLASYPIMMPFFHDRSVHWDHHRFVGTPKDPDAAAWDWPEHQRGLLVREYISVLTGYVYFEKIFRVALGRKPKPPMVGRPVRRALEGSLKRKEVMRLFAVHLGIFALFAVTLGPIWYVPLWLFPALSFFPMWGGLRELLEHRRGALIVYRSNPVERFLLGCFNFHLHAYHHAHASAPWFTLPVMKERAHSKVKDIVYLDGYFPELWRFARGKSTVPSRELDPEPMPAGDGQDVDA